MDRWNTNPGTPVFQGNSLIRFETTASVSAPITDSRQYHNALLRPQPARTSALPTEPQPVGMAGFATNWELINNSANQLFLVIHDKAGIQNLRDLGMVPAQLWGPWGPFSTGSLTDILHTDFNRDFILLFVDKKYPAPGVRAFMESITVGPNQDSLNITARVVDPPAGLTAANRPVSPYDIIVLGKSLFKQNQPVRISVSVNGKTPTEQVLTIRKQGQGLIDEYDVYGSASSGRIEGLAKQSISSTQGVPVGNLEQVSGRGPVVDGVTSLGVRFHGYEFRDVVTGKSYRIIVDPYGRVLSESAIGRLRDIDRRAKLALASGGMDPEMEEQLRGKPDQYSQAVEIWFRPVNPGASFAEAASLLSQSLRQANVQPKFLADKPALSAVMTTKTIREMASRDDVLVITKDQGEK